MNIPDLHYIMAVKLLEFVNRLSLHKAEPHGPEYMPMDLKIIL